MPFAGWLTRLLPHVEQEPLWRLTENAYRAVPFDPFHLPHYGMFTPVRLYACPADGRAGVVGTTHGDRRVTFSSYLGVNGRDYRTRDGVLFADSRVRLADITDGTSGTLAAVERPPSADLWYGWWYAAYGQRGTGSGDTVLGAAEVKAPDARHADGCPAGPYAFGPGRLDRQCDLFHFWSVHPGGANALFCDGAVRFVRYAAADVLPALASRAGGEVAALPD